MMSTFPLTTRYLDDEVYMQLGRYIDESIAIRLMLASGEPAATATVCLAEYKKKPGPGNVFIQDWGSCDGMKDGLIAAGIISEPIQEIPVGGHDAIAYECKLLIVPDDMRAEFLT